MLQQIYNISLAKITLNTITKCLKNNAKRWKIRLNIRHASRNIRKSHSSLLIHASGNSRQVERFLWRYNWTRKGDTLEVSWFQWLLMEFRFHVHARHMFRGNRHEASEQFSPAAISGFSSIVVASFLTVFQRERLHLRQRRMHTEDWENVTQLPPKRNQ